MNMVTAKQQPTVIADTATLAAFCQRLSSAPFVAIDTEFLRDKTYWPVLCLVQLAGPDEAAAIDALAEGIDLAPLLNFWPIRRSSRCFTPPVRMWKSSSG